MGKLFSSFVLINQNHFLTFFLCFQVSLSQPPKAEQSSSQSQSGTEESDTSSSTGKIQTQQTAKDSSAVKSNVTKRCVCIRYILSSNLLLIVGMGRLVRNSKQEISQFSFRTGSVTPFTVSSQGFVHYSTVHS